VRALGDLDIDNLNHRMVVDMAEVRQQRAKLIAIRRLALSSFLLLTLVPTALSEHLSLKVFTSADGLGSSYVSDVMRDSSSTRLCRQLEC